MPVTINTGKIKYKDSNDEFQTLDAVGGIEDVQVNGTSIIDSEGAANIKLGDGLFHNPVTGQLATTAASNDNIKGGELRWVYVDARRAYGAAFYGLAKAAGADMKDVSGATVGVYPEAQKSAIHEMLNGSVSVSGSTPSITALPGIRYICGEVLSLNITLPNSGIIDVVFESGSTPTVLTITPPTGQTVKWTNDFDPTSLDANTTYEINIADGLGVAVGWT